MDLSKLFLTIISIFYCSFQFNYMISSEVDRKIPSDPDDSYHAILKASNLVNCLQSSCVALDDIYLQTNQNFEDNQKGMFADRQEHRILFSYHPLYSSVIATLRQLEISYEDSKLITDLFGVLLVCFSIVLFLVNFFGIVPASVALISLIAWSMMGHGLLQVNYVMFSFSFALLAWSFHVMKGNYLINTSISTIALFFSSMSHPVGVIYIMVSLVFVSLKEFLKEFSINLKVFFQLLISLVLIGLFLLVDIDFTSKEISLTALYEVNNSYKEMFLRNWQGIKSFFYFLNENFVSIPLALILTLSGLFLIENIHIKNVLIMSFILSGLFLSSLIFPNIPGDAGSTILYRISPIFYIFLYGFIGVIGSQIFLSENRKILLETIKLENLKANIYSLPKIILSFFVIFLSIITLFNNIDKAKHKIKENINLDNISLDVLQVEKLLLLSSPKDKVLYLTGVRIGDRIGEAINYFYLTHGSLKRGFIWNELIKDTPSEDFWLQKDIRFLVTKNPVIENGLNSNILINNKNKIFINPQSVLNKDLYLNIEGNQSAALNVIYKNQSFILEGPFLGWTEIPIIFDTHKKDFSIELSGSNEPILLKGIRFGNQLTNWPWDSKVNLDILDNNRSVKKIDFNFESLWDNNNLKIKNIVDDNGASVLAELEKIYE